MSRRLVLTAVAGTLLAGGLAGSALADSSADTSTSHKVCVMLSQNSSYLPPGYCIGWDDTAVPSVTPGS